MRNHLFLVLGYVFIPVVLLSQENQFRPPAVPLVTNNPYFSIWSFSDHPANDWPRHWTGTVQALCSFVRIDGKNYRLLGKSIYDLPAMRLVKTEITPTLTKYYFEENGVKVNLSLLSPLLPDDLVLLSEPLTYLTWHVEPIDGKPHDINIYFDATAELVVNSWDQKVNASRSRIEGLDVLRIGTADQPILEKAGDDLRIDWGYLYLVCPEKGNWRTVISGADLSRKNFLANRAISQNDDLNFPRRASEDWPVLACSTEIKELAGPVDCSVLLAYDDIYRVEFLARRLRPYWRSSGITTSQMMQNALERYDEIAGRCARFDSSVRAGLLKKGGEEYCDIAIAAFRQSFAACTLAGDMDGTAMYFPKENFSNGCISTVDVIYPACPILLYFNPALLKAQLEPLLIYASTSRWKFPFAPHDLGTFPLANGQVYGGGELTEEDQMPVEESGNMLIMLYAIAKADGNADFAKKYWPIIAKWAAYLQEKGFDPENQLCTDDFAGHLAHNVNLSVKSIEALGCYAKLCDLMGKKEESDKVYKLSKSFAGKWKQMAKDGDHYRLAFDKPGSWSQKYNLVWDKILNLNLFEPDIAEQETKFYMKIQNRYGLPLDNRKDYTKLDWIFWTASLTGKKEDFLTMIRPVHTFLNETPDRVPMTDWYDTKTGKQVGFQARSVVGGVFIRMLVK